MCRGSFSGAHARNDELNHAQVDATMYTGTPLSHLVSANGCLHIVTLLDGPLFEQEAGRAGMWEVRADTLDATFRISSKGPVQLRFSVRERDAKGPFQTLSMALGTLLSRG